MRQIKFSDVNKRLKSLHTMSGTGSGEFVKAANLISCGRVSDIKRFIESYANSNNETQFGVYMDLFEEVINSGTVNDINNVGTLLIEKALPKIRNSKETNSLINRRLGRLKSKLKPKNSAVTESNPKQKNKINESNYKAAVEILDKMNEESYIISECDRVLDNYNTISKIFNLENLFETNSRINGIYDTTISLCKLVDVYTSTDLIKFNTIIETAWYGFESRYISYNKSEVLEAATDFFLFRDTPICEYKEKVLEATLFYDKDDIDKIDVFTEEEPEPECDGEKDIDTQIRDYANPVHEDMKLSENDKKNFTNILNKFKKEEAKENPQHKLKNLIGKLYSRDVNGVIEGTPKFLSWIRTFFILGTTGIPVIGPVLGAITFIADKVITNEMERKQLSQMVRCFKTEMKNTKEKINSISDNEDKRNLEKYYETLKKAEQELESKYMELFGDDEDEEKYSRIDVDDGESDDFDFNFDDFDLLESSIKNLNNIKSIIESYIDNGYIKEITANNMYNLMQNIDSEDIINVTAMVEKYPEIFYKDSVIQSINDILNNKTCIKYESVIDKALRRESLSISKNILNSSTNTDKYENLDEVANDFPYLMEAYNAIGVMIHACDEKHTNTIMEASFTNSIKMASMKLRQAMTKMSDKEKNISRKVDQGTSNLTKGIEKVLTSDNRESIIKGSIIPSASKIIKLGIMNASLIILGQPVLAVIATLGYLGTSKKFRDKERQMMIDEIEIELKLCKKYIDIAEQNNDMKALKQLLTTQRELERQHSRLKYKMKLNLSTRYYDAKHADGEYTGISN